MIWSELKIGDVVMVCEEEFGVIRNITSIMKIGEVVKFKSGNFGIISDVDLAGQRDYCFNGEFYRYDKGDDLRTAAGDGYIYTMKTGYCYTSNQFSIANMDKKSTREAYVLWMLEN